MPTNPTILYSKEMDQTANMVKPEEVHQISSRSGNFVIHIPVSRDLTNSANYKEGDEFTQ